MHGSFRTQKMNPQVSAYGDKWGGWCDDGQMRAYTRKKDDNSKPRNKRNYSSARKLKESYYAYS